MARTTIKATYSLSPDTVDQLQRLARRWGISKSAALSRAIGTVVTTLEPATATKAFDDLQQQAALSSTTADRWAHSVVAERAASRRTV